jgi:hypothetical protein
MKERDELQELQAEAEVFDALLVHPEFAADVKIMQSKSTSYTSILNWLDTAIRKSHTPDNGFVEREYAYYNNFLANYE